jgi:hypothetical protein
MTMEQGKETGAAIHDAIVVELIKLLPTLMWIGLIVWAIYHFRDVLHALALAIKSRVVAGGGIKLWMLELERIEPSRIQPREIQAGHVRIFQEDRETLIDSTYAHSQYAMLVHAAYKTERQNEYEVILYLLGHWNNLDQVSYVEYYLGTEWGHNVFRSSDRTKNFAVRILSFGSALSIAKIYFTDGTSSVMARYFNTDIIR